MDEKDIQQTLTVILDSLKSKKLVWRMDGSANLRIQGIDVPVNDLDITTDDKGIKTFRTALKQFVVKDFFNEKIKGHSLVCSIIGFEVEINSYQERDKDMFDRIKKITWNNLKVPILPLKYAKKFYELIGRKEKAELISKFLSG